MKFPKQRVKWDEELHASFLNALSRLGGPDRATPSAILRMMDAQGLTISNVKSHLQKYRFGRRMNSSEGQCRVMGHESESYSMEKEEPAVDSRKGQGISRLLHSEWLLTQLHQHIEKLRILQGIVEQQSKSLQQMAEDQQILIRLLDFQSIPCVSKTDRKDSFHGICGPMPTSHVFFSPSDSTEIRQNHKRNSADELQSESTIGLPLQRCKQCRLTDSQGLQNQSLTPHDCLIEWYELGETVRFSQTSPCPYDFPGRIDLPPSPQYAWDASMEVHGRLDFW